MHGAANENGRLIRFRHLAAGRRGGKTLSAAWETLFYCLYPEVFHRDAHSVESSRPLWVWVGAKDSEIGRPARMAFLQALADAGLKAGKDYKYNKTERTIEFENGSFLQFRTFDNPQALRGAGLDILWIDEAAFLPDREAWDVVRPALGDKVGLLITTTTPKGRNWLWEEFFDGKALTDSLQFSVEYVSIDNPFYPKAEWEYAQEHMHPAVFAQEHLASFDAMHGIALSGDWLHYYTQGKSEPGADEVELPRGEDGRLRLRRYIGVDPATGVETGDDFAMACIGVAEDNTQAYLLDYYLGKIPFPEQIDKIREWQLKYRPHFIGIESNAYQRSLAQQASRLQGLPGIIPIISRGKKADRITAMAPIFRIGKMRIHRSHNDFIDQWVSYDPAQRIQRDDLLDAVEIALGVAGVLLPTMDTSLEPKGPSSIHEEAMAQIKANKGTGKQYDPELGSEM
jgi:phage terminase large subunit-like protein